MGVILVIGLTSLWPISIGLSIFWLYWNRTNIKVNSNSISLFILLALSGIIMISAVYSPSPGSAIYYASAIALSPILASNISAGRKLWIPLHVLSGIQIVWVITEYYTGVIRPAGISDNGSALGIYGLMTLSPLSALVISLSLSRTALAGLFIFAFLRNRKVIYALFVLTFVVHVSIQLWIQPERLSISGISQSIELRIDAIEGISTETSPTATIYSKRELSLFGYGYNGYVSSTGQIQPHNIYVLSVWELGILAVPFWILLTILLWRSHNPYMLIPALLALNVDEWYTLTEGVFYLTIFHILTRNLPYTLTFPGTSLILKRVKYWDVTQTQELDDD